MTRKEMAQALYDAWQGENEEAILEAENAVCDLLDVPLDWTEQGLNIKAENVLRTFLRDNGFDAPPTWSVEWSVDPA